MKILITGGAGFIASHVADLYINNGHEVAVVDNLSTGKKEFVNPKAKFYQADITDQQAIENIIAEFKPEVLNLHAAHIQVGYSVENPQFDAQNNILGLLNLMQSAQKHNVKKVIMASTGGAMYGNKQTPFSETMKEEPLSPYGVSKRAGELYLNYFYQQYGIEFIALRYSNVYGPRQNAHGESGVIAIFAEKMAEGITPVINGDGTHTRDYVFVKDVAQANLLALNCSYIGAINIGTKTEVSTNQVYQEVAKEFGISTQPKYGPPRPGEQVTSSLDYSLAKQELNWQPTIEFHQGVKQVVAWYKTRSNKE